LSFTYEITGGTINENEFLEKSQITQTTYYKIRAKKGDWVEYKFAEILGKEIVFLMFKTLFLNASVSLNENTSVVIKVLDKKVVEFGKYSREFAIINATINEQPAIPFWFYEKILSIRQLPIDGYSPFMPVDETFWNDFKELMKFWADQIAPYGFQVMYDIRKCFYRLRIDNLLIGWTEAYAVYDDHYGALKEFSIAFALTQSFIEEISKEIGAITVDSKPFMLEAGKLYRTKINMVNTNIPDLINVVKEQTPDIQYLVYVGMLAVVAVFTFLALVARRRRGERYHN
jgi:hypothetical protein